MIAYARSELLYDNALDGLRALKPASADYIAALPHNLYSVAFFTGARFEHYTSNIVEAANALFLEQRKLPVLDMLHGILEKEMDRRSSRQERAMKLPVTKLFTPYGRAKFTVSNHFAQQNNVQMQSVLEGTGTVTQRDGRAFQVNLEATTCSCKRY